jgi:hypothetical protein
MAVRPASRRLDKWDAMFSGDVVSTKLAGYKEKIREQLATIFPLQESVENEIKLILAEARTSTIMNQSYINFGREVYKLAIKFSGTQLINAVDIVLNKWGARGLDQGTLEKIRNTIFTLAVPIPPGP